MTSKYISIRQFAKLVGVSDTSIHKARSAGRLTDKSFRTNPKNKRPEVILDVALVEWKAQAGPELEVISPFPGTKKTPVNKKKTELITDRDEEEFQDDDDLAVPRKARGNDTMAEANRLKAIHDANLKRSELMEAQGLLIKREKVYNTLYEMGQEIKTELQGIPDKHIDNILACKTRAEAHKVLTDAINAALISLADTKSVKFGNR